MQQYFAYVRVSTAKQGEKGVSLQEQTDAISNYAQRFGLGISQWFEERETAAKRGRTVFAKMLRLLQQKRSQGVIIHKIDRSARNLKDWADLGEMIDAGVDVHSQTRVSICRPAEDDSLPIFKQSLRPTTSANYARRRRKASTAD
jgi:site-specific DNA recombinase